MEPKSDKHVLWVIVSGDERTPEWVPYDALDLKSVPVQYCRLDWMHLPLQRALQMATSLTVASRVLLTAMQEHRDRWEPHAWFVRSSLRFTSHASGSAPLALATAILRVAEQSPSCTVVVLPARSYVAHQSVLREAIVQAVSSLPRVPEGIASLGMLDIEDAFDEDYLVVQRASSGPGLMVSGIARRPTSWVARHLRRKGAVVSSGILVGYAGALAAHISKYWPGLAAKLIRLSREASASNCECAVPSAEALRVQPIASNALRWDPPILPQRVFPVNQCGWSGLRSPHEVIRIAEFLNKDRWRESRHCETEGVSEPLLRV
jgi:mannose-1-phosphate guanylyltransferase